MEEPGSSLRLHLDVYDPASSRTCSGARRGAHSALLLRLGPPGGRPGQTGQTGDGAFGRVRFFGLPPATSSPPCWRTPIDISWRQTRLSAATWERLATLPHPSTCRSSSPLPGPHCPAWPGLAHQMAMESERVTADVIEANEFPT